jgi:hypothetical protein
MADFLPTVQTATITAGGTAQLLVAASAIRSSLVIQPQTEDCLVNFGATAGVQATGTLTVTTNPDVDDTIAVNGVTFTFKASSASATQITIGATQTETAANMVTILNASVHASVSIATYSSSSAIVTITHDAGGADGNAFTLANSSGGDITRSAATLAGGSDTVGGLLLVSENQYVFDASQFPSIRQGVYVVSVTDSAKIAYLEGNQ